MKMIVKLCLILCFALPTAILCSNFVTQTQGEVWPKPQQQTKTDQQLSLSRNFQISYELDYCEILEEAIQRYWPIIITGFSVAKPFKLNNKWQGTETVLQTLTLRVTDGCTTEYPTSSMDESYTLNVSAGESTLESAQVWGALRGLETFAQLVYTDSETTMRAVNKTTITDYPRFGFRGFLIDTSRHYLSLNTIKLHLDAMEATKYNVLHWHIVDDPSFPFVSEIYRYLSEYGAYHPETHTYTHTDIQEILDYARLRGIRVVPEFDTPGHTFSWGQGYPKLLSECIDGNGHVSNTGPLEPRNMSTYTFVWNLFSEVNQLFPDESLFLGGDEVSFSCWQSNPVYQAFIDENNLGDYAGLESYYIQNLLELVSSLKNKRTPIVWQEVYDNGLNITSDTVINVWKNNNYDNELSLITKDGYIAILSAPWYLNYIAYGEDWKNYYAVEPLDFDGTDEQKKLVVGCEACMWGEYVDDSNFLSRTWPRAAAVSERAWSSVDTTDVSDAERRLTELRCRLIKRRIPAEPFAPGFCQVEWQ